MSSRLNSRYLKFDSRIKIRHYNFSTPLSMVSQKTYICGENDFIEYITRKFYGDPTLYWIILGCNRIVDPFKPLEAGQRLIIPDISILDLLKG